MAPTTEPSFILSIPYHDLALRICETDLPCAYHALFLSNHTHTSMGPVDVSPTCANRAHRVTIAVWYPRRGEGRSYRTGFAREGSSRCGGSRCCRAGPRACGRFCEEARYPESIWRAWGVSKYVID